MKAGTWLDRTVNIAILVAVGFFVTTQVRLWRHADAHPAPAGYTAYTEGETLPEFAGLSSGGSTVLVFVNSNCTYCTASMPFYARLSSEMSKAGRQADLVVASREPVETSSSYLERHNVSVPRVISLESDKAPLLKLTPTLMIVSREGRIERLWNGQLSPDAESEVLKLVANES
jgi:peroxiredoxin